MEFLKKLISECDDFKKEELLKTQEEIYKDYTKIYFYEHLGDYFRYHLATAEFHSEKEINRLKEIIGNRTMSVLLDDFLSSENAYIEYFNDIPKFLISTL